MADLDYRLVLDSFSDAVVASDESNRITYVNAATLKLLGWTREELIGQSLTLLMPMRMRAGHQTGFERFIHSHSSRIIGRPIRVPALHKDGFELDIELTLSAFKVAGDKDLIVACLRDLRDRVELERQIEYKAAAQAEARRSRFLADASTALSASLDYKQTLVKVAHLAVPTIADWCTVAVLDPSGAFTRVAVVHADRSKEALVQAYERAFPPSDHRDGGLSTVLDSGKSILMAKVDDEMLVSSAQNPEHLEILRGLGVFSCVMVPLRSAARHTIGVISLMSSHPNRIFGEEDLATAEDLAGRASLAIDNSRLYEAEVLARGRLEEAERRSKLLEEASTLLGSSLDYDATLKRLAQLVITHLADWCSITLVESEQGAVRRVTVAHRDPAKVRVADELERRYPSDPNATRGIPNVLRTGKGELYPRISTEGLAAMAQGPEHLNMLTELGMQSAMIVPLLVRGRTLGAITFVSAESGRRYGPSELGLAQELADRAAHAVDNAILYQEAREAIRLRDDFLSVASHELKTPLTPLQLQIQSLQRATKPGALDQVSAKVSSKLALIGRQVGRLEKLVNSLFDVTKLSRSALLVELEEIDLTVLVQEVSARFKDQCAQSNSELSVQVGSAPIVGRWDRLRLEQVVSNLLTNALKFGPGKPIEVTLEQRDGVALLRVADQGIGIAAEDQERVFGRFERGVSERNYGGLGLGLWIVRQILERFGGSITVESVLRRGARFTVKLPLQPLEEPAPPKD